MANTDNLQWGAVPLAVETRELFSDGREGDYEIIPEEPIRPHWRTLKRWLKAVGFSSLERAERHDRFSLGGMTLALTRDGRFILEGVKPPTGPTALALAQLFLCCDRAADRRRPQDDANEAKRTERSELCPRQIKPR
ncbi:MAG: hypothetical protein A2Y64_06740 [Candidatus Coatesbacteria bacterium RBG_13_66_14]|uniref:Uncharacterized protein n=1 Tax=Candidatus Coatesbacteria bacterium RBG_13_66_14 TaxID=1817816 RepID=A0A1F5FHF4_9BACT|nr:MAG: hypothetical protein A2Y64_06740 [Candidatus Coatesbacteria bacterium RBG_13_66_14]